ncbi:MerR family transcriptional regulator [Companilactobacillus allii]|uniref:MerR family transcriptional regulator n=2 Tax=Companilactobacillus allii TaxID=1847728 RepID=A0A1P8Q691_9LACO|nr:MerR family transcriptional regulator [Companilactobacillus allii]APX73365.1 MerR family transcriptional regulator [Companilactobacillus allii]USQ69863.1 MerR family transcriptional regulator [Companilactobacillus allii]
MNSKQVSEIMDLPVATLRYYEKIGVIPPIGRDKNGYRDYRPNDLNWIFLTKCLKQAGLSLKLLKEFADLNQKDEDTSEERKDILREQLDDLNDKLDEMNKTRDLLVHKIDTFDDHMVKFESGEMDEDHVEELWTMGEFQSSKK